MKIKDAHGKDGITAMPTSSQKLGAGKLFF